MRAQKTCTLREGLRYEEVGLVPIEHMAANNRKDNKYRKTAFPRFTSFHSVFHSFHGSGVDELNKLASLQCMGLHSLAGRALQR